MSQRKSDVWKHFSKKSKEEAECQSCHKILKCVGGSTSGLKAHLSKIHAINPESEASVSFNKNELTLMRFLPKKSTEEAIAKMACKDGFSFRQIASSEFIQSNLATNAYNTKPPTTGNGVKKVVLKYFEARKAELAEYFSHQIKAEHQYSISLDEYTSSQNRRFMNINVHDAEKHWSLGLVHIQGSLPSKRITEVLKKRLSEFGLDLDRDIVGVTTDGASLMVKFGKDNQFIHQLCLAHGTHLSVCDILYKKKQLEEDVEEEHELEEENEEIPDDWDDYDTPLDTAFDSDEAIDDTSVLEIQGNVGEVVAKVRKICRMFRKSPVKNDYLQEIIKANLKDRELHLILDTKTRWNSTIAMISRFIELKNCIPNALRVCGIAEVISDCEWRSLEALVSVLRPFEIVIKGLSSADASLLKGENSMAFILKEMDSQSSQLAIDLKKALSERYSSHRLTNVIGLIRYLEDPEILKRNEPKETFCLPNHKNVKKLAEFMCNRLFPSGGEAKAEKDDDADSETLKTESAVDDPMLQRYISEVTSKNKRIKLSLSPTLDLGKEMKLFEATGKRPERLEKLYRGLLTIRATSVESERAFSSAGYFLSKIRSRLSPKSLDALCFLRSYFSANK